MSISKFGDWAGEQWDNITGATAADAAEEAGQLQYQATQDAIAQQQAAQQQLQQNLQPYMSFGQGFIPQVQQSFAQGAELYGPGASDAIMNNPMFQAIQNQVQQDILGNQAVRGRVGTGETPMFLQESALRTGFDILNSERNANAMRTNQLLQALGIGQSSAAGVGNAGIQTAGQVGSLLAQGGNALASGVVGAANAQQQGTQNLIGLGTAALTGGASLPFTGGPRVAPQFGFGS